PGPETHRRPSRAAMLQDLRASGVSGSGPVEVEPALHVGEAAAGPSSRGADESAGEEASSLWLSPRPRLAGARRLAGQSEADSAAVESGRAEGAAAAAEAATPGHERERLRPEEGGV